MKSPLQPQPIQRADLLARLREPQPWDAVIVGGGATGLGIAVDAAARGLRVALIEARDFGSGTSSRSTKLVHGGVRYLAQGNVKLVREALEERATLLAIAPHLVHPLEFVVPCYRPLERPFLRVGLGMYDLLAGRRSVGPTRWLSRDETLARLPGIRPEGLRGGVSYWDGQFDDALMCIALMQTAYALGATPINYVCCEGLHLRDGRIASVRAVDAETGESFELATTCVFNAAGVWVDGVRRLADPDARKLITVSQGSHLVVERDFLPGSAALMIPKTRDGRVLFVIPWFDKLLIGTTDGPRPDAPWEPQPSREEIEFMLETARGYLARPITTADVRASFAGLRPLFDPGRAGSTAAISREHAVLTEFGNLISIVGGKWTTYRKMAVDALAAARRAGLLDARSARTEDLALVVDRVLVDPARRSAPDAGYAEHCRRFTQARTAEDIVARRARLAYLDRARAERTQSAL
ncbi:MAG: glycerol-3-phosphate dehydrogenase [Betaproteobacteria bacterium]|nr:MAG: glycerol-3-phosphate dehydrogenase [Betaproteobacteria bacterium]